MRRFAPVRPVCPLVCLLVCLFAVLAMPVPAHALFWHWLDELSGPGTFNGYEVEVRVVCFSKPGEDQRAAIEEKRPHPMTKAIVGAIPPGCVFKRIPITYKRTSSLNLAASWLYANHTHLTYAAEREGVEHYVHLLTLRPRYWLRPARSVEVGAGVGFYRFSGPGFDPIWRTVLEPFLVDVKPIALVRDALGLSDKAEIAQFPDSQWDLLISFRAGYVYSPKGFTAEEFGAVPGTFETKRELLPTASVLVDMDWILRRLRRPKDAAPIPRVP